MAGIPIGLELYSVRHELEKDVRGTLEAVAKMGYAGVEFAGPPKNEATYLRELLDEFGLVCCGWHCPYNLVQDDQLEATIERNKILGNKFVIVPGIPGDLRQTRDDWIKIADFFNELADKLAPHGLVTGYHNHQIEFTELDGEQPWDTLFGNTRKDVVMQLDTGNARFGGGDVVSVLKKYPGRSQSTHLKPYSVAAGRDNPRDGFRPLFDDDDTPWEEVFALCETTGETEWYVVEYECDAHPAMEAVDLCLRQLRAMGK